MWRALEHIRSIGYTPSRSSTGWLCASLPGNLRDRAVLPHWRILRHRRSRAVFAAEPVLYGRRCSGPVHGRPMGTGFRRSHRRAVATGVRAANTCRITTSALWISGTAACRLDLPVCADLGYHSVDTTVEHPAPGRGSARHCRTRAGRLRLPGRRAQGLGSCPSPASTSSISPARATDDHPDGALHLSTARSTTTGRFTTTARRDVSFDPPPTPSDPPSLPRARNRVLQDARRNVRDHHRRRSDDAP